MSRIIVFSLILTMLLSLVSCSREPLNDDIGWYGFDLPSYCDNNHAYLEVLEKEAKKYGTAAVDMGYFGSWQALVNSMAIHYCVWADYESAVKVTEVYASRQWSGEFIDYYISSFLLMEREEFYSTFASDLEKHRYLEAFLWDDQDVLEAKLYDSNNVKDRASFDSWEFGLDSLRVLAARLLAGEDDAEVVILETLKRFYLSERLLEAFSELACETPRFVLAEWLEVSVLFERYAIRVEDDVLIEEIWSARRYLSDKFEEEGVWQNLMNCAVDERGAIMVLSKEGGNL